NLIFLNYNGHIVNTIKYEKIEGKRIPVSVDYPHGNSFFQNSKTFCINTGHNDTIHEIDNLHKLVPKYIINLGKFKLPDKYRVEFVNLDKFDKLSAPYIRPVLIETNNLLLVQFNTWLDNSNIKPLGLHDVNTGSLGLGVFEKHNSRFSIISQEVTDRYIPCFYPYFSDGNEHLISYISALDALEYYKKNKANPTLFKPFATMMHHTKESDNPIIIVANVKNTIYEK
ncbi:MAG: hypothetical protein Q7U86_08585, partial [Draconibacterium sp.]|nr:hypothetical protein [Draconibacterium sp.]